FLNHDQTHDYSLECDTRELPQALIKTANTLYIQLNEWFETGIKFVKLLTSHYQINAPSTHDNPDQHEPKTTDTHKTNINKVTQQKADFMIKNFHEQALTRLENWILMLQDLIHDMEPITSDTPPKYYDRLILVRKHINFHHIQDIDVGLYRHWLDPLLPFSQNILTNIDGLAITSATLLDQTEPNQTHDDPSLQSTPTIDAQWANAYQRVGFDKCVADKRHGVFETTFDYQRQSQIYIATDIDLKNAANVAQALAHLFSACNGGGLALFTAIRRLYQVYQHLAPRMQTTGRRLLCQHVDSFSLPSLIEIFKADKHSCILGTDSLRDGVDIPGQALRLVCFERVPWPRPDLLHKARRKIFGGRQFDEQITRLRLKQAFGRLIRNKTDHGVFVMLDPKLPSRLHNAFPPNVKIKK
ncbi:MAG: helicase C-terminal domain-containing protein, partial [Pseudomonadota bacterium]